MIARMRAFDETSDLEAADRDRDDRTEQTLQQGVEPVYDVGEELSAQYEARQARSGEPDR